jgi:hypothetical protein
VDRAVAAKDKDRSAFGSARRNRRMSKKVQWEKTTENLLT